MTDKIQIGYRASEKMNDMLDSLAEEWDTSKNSVINILLKIGLRTYESLAIHHPQSLPHVLTHTHSETPEQRIPTAR
jgi:hypothetical protein